MTSKRELDYIGTYGRADRFGVEVKLPTWRFETHRMWIERLLRQATEVGLVFLVVTSFEQLAVYYCQAVTSTDTLTSPLLFLSFHDYERRWQELASLLSRDVLESPVFGAPRDAAEPPAESEEWRAQEVQQALLHRPLRFDRLEQTALSLYGSWKDKRLELHSGFQRGVVWSLEEQSRFVESVLLRIPLPPVYLAEQGAEGKSKWIVVDGRQRLLSMFYFMDGRFTLRGLTLLSQLNGMRFADLDSRLRRRFEDAPITTIVIESGSDPEAVSAVFQRLNPAWSAHKVRRALQSGPGLTMIERLAAPDGLFRRLLGTTRSIRNSQAEEWVLRVLAFFDQGPEAYSGFMADFLTHELARLNGMSEDERAVLEERVLRALEWTQRVFGDEAFHRFNPGTEQYSPAIDPALMDVRVWGFDAVSADWQRRAEEVRARARKLQSDLLFIDALSHGAERVSRVRMRFDLWKRMLLDVASHHA